MRTEYAALTGLKNNFGLGFYKYAAPDGALVGTLRGDVPAGAFPFLASGIFEQPARRGQECAGRRTAQRAIPTTLAGHQGGRRQRPGQWQFGVDERDKGCGAEKSQRDFII